MSILTYKGYQASVTYEEETLFIRVLHIDDTLIEECEIASEVSETFHALIDDYIETCREVGREPNKPFKGSFNVRITPELHRVAAMSAALSEKSLNAWVAEAIEEKLTKMRMWKEFAFADPWSFVDVPAQNERQTQWETEKSIEKTNPKLMEFTGYMARYGN
jgi:predicted HicB family RNase H-like nuclease